MKRDVFISYKSSSLPLVEKLAELLEHNNILCWYAPRNLNEDGLGKEFDDEIVNAIKNTSAVIVLLNDLALTSKWVKRELTQAEKQGKLILPYVIEQLTVENGLSMRLESTHMIPAFPSPEDNFPVLLNSVQHLLGKTDVSSIKEDIPEDNTKPERASGGSDDPTIYDLDYEEGLAFLEADEEADAFHAFLRSAIRHNTKSYEQLFKIMHHNNKNADFLDADTWDEIEELSDNGEGFADLLMHYRYFGMGTQNEIALKYLQRALNKQVSPFAFLQMGICYGWGMGVKQSEVQRLHYYKKAYENGCYEATWYLAQLYLYGGERTPIDVKKAELFAKEGAEKGVTSCYGFLSEIYLANNRKEEAQQLAQDMIDHHIKGGYRLMGDYYQAIEETEKAKEYYQLATENNDNKAWGDLCLIHYYTQDYDELFRLAQKGVHENDSYCYMWLAWSYEHKEDYEQAWYWYMHRVRIYGNSADLAANLYLTHDYTPDAEALEEVKRYLVIDTQRQIYSSAEALLKIILREHGESTDFTFEKLQNLPETYDILRRAAEMTGNADDNKELQYIYGRILLEDSGKYHDPYKGSKFILTSAKRNYKPAITYAFNHFSNESQLRELASKIITDNFDILHSETYVTTILRLGKDNVPAEMLLAWIDDVLNQLHKAKYTPDRFTLYKIALDKYKELEQDVPEKLKERIRREVDNDLGMSAMGYLNILEDHIPYIFPNYEEDEKLAFYHSVPTEPLAVCTNQPLEKPFFSYLAKGTDEELTLDKEILPTGELRKSYQELLDAYTDLATEGSVDVLNTQLTFQPTDYLPYCNLSTAVEHMRRAWKMLQAAKKAYGEHWQDIWNNISNQDELLNIAEKLGEIPTAQLLLVEFVEVYIEAQSIILDVNGIRSAIFREDNIAVIKSLNEKIDEMTKSEIKHHLTALPEDAEIPFM